MLYVHLEYKLKMETDANFSYHRKSENYFLERKIAYNIIEGFITFNDSYYVIGGEIVKWKWEILN